MGPSAHSFNGKSRQWNVSNIEKYIFSIKSGKIPAEIEALTVDQKYNEYVLTSIRTIWGSDSNFILNQFGISHLDNFKKNIDKYMKNNKVSLVDHRYCLTDSGKLFADGIAADLFS